MANTLDELRIAVRTNFQEISNWIDIESSIEQAVDYCLRHINKDVPRNLVIEVEGDGTSEYDISEFFDKEISVIKAVEYPVGENPRSYLEASDDYFLYEDPDGDVSVVLADLTVASTSSFRVVLTTNHTLTDTTTTLGNQAFGALVAKVSEHIALQIQARLVYSADSAIDADVVNFGQKNRSIKSVAEFWGAEYKKLAGLDKDVKAAMAQSDADVKMTNGGDYIWHPARNR